MTFKPVGEKAQWKIVFDVFEQTTPGDTVSYRTLADALGMMVKGDLPRIQAAARKAGAELLRRRDRAVEAVTGEGYRVVPAAHQISMAGGQIERATNSLDKGRDLTTNIKMDELNEGDRALVQVVALGFAQVATYARQIGRRLTDHEDRLTDIEQELARMREERNKS